MIYDFVYSKFGSRRVQNIIPYIQNLKRAAKAKNWPVIYLQDSHTSKDIELKLWGEHAMIGTRGSEIIEELKPELGDIVIKKNVYDGFFNTRLNEVLKDRNVKKLIFAGVSIDICILNTVASAFYRGYDIIICKECIESMSEKNKNFGLNYIKKIFGGQILSFKTIGGFT